MAAVLELAGIELSYGGGSVLRGFDLSVESSETVALLGPSGCGKTSVLRLLLGFLSPAAGHVRLAGRLAGSAGEIVLPPEERNLAVVFQDLALWPHLTVRGNLEFGMECRGVPRAERKSRIDEMLETVSLAGKHHRRPGELSGGERQRVAIARALVLEPLAVLLDEPLANLDVGLKRELIAEFRQLFKARAVAALYVTHDLREATQLGDRIAILEEGRVAQAGTLADLRRCPCSPFVTSLLEDLEWKPPRL